MINLTPATDCAAMARLGVPGSRPLAGSPFVVALSKSHLPPA